MDGMRRPKHKVVTGPGVKATPKADNFHDALPLELAGRADGPGVSSKTWRLPLDRITRQPIHF